MPIPILDTLRSVLRFRSFEWDPVVRRLNRCASVEDFRRIAQQRLPSGVFDYIDGAAEDERTLERNSAAFRALGFRPRVLREVGEPGYATTILGRDATMPLICSPTGFGRTAHSQGELAVARAAANAGIPYTLSTLSTRSIEDVAAVSSGSKWFQVYVWHDRELVKEMVERSAAAGYEALLLTVDTPVFGRRERDVRSGFSLPPKLGLDTILDGILHPGWTFDFLTAEPIIFANVVGREVGDGSTPVALAEYINTQFDPGLSWRDVEWLQSIWKGPIVLKGIQTVEDARIAADTGVSAVALSNHGGRQLDDAPTPLELLESVAGAVGDRVEVYCDGGVRRGSDVVKALALGARACMIGRAYLYALAAGGERGVDLLFGWLAEGIGRTLALTGAASVDDLSRELVEWRRPLSPE
ncbi:MAG: alpha-hydroxy acid oxidase [Candidatus Binatia bacterium]|nr:alpha-hydroxy acid oxidase [Candidatus Binatia bacterium]